MSNQVYSHSPIWWGGKSRHGFVKNLDEKFFRITLDKDYGHYLRVIICLFRPDFPQIPCPTDFSRFNELCRADFNPQCPNCLITTIVQVNLCTFLILSQTLLREKKGVKLLIFPSSNIKLNLPSVIILLRNRM